MRLELSTGARETPSGYPMVTVSSSRELSVTDRSAGRGKVWDFFPNYGWLLVCTVLRRPSPVVICRCSGIAMAIPCPEEGFSQSSSLLNGSHFYIPCFLFWYIPWALGGVIKMTSLGLIPHLSRSSSWVAKCLCIHHHSLWMVYSLWMEASLVRTEIRLSVYEHRYLEGTLTLCLPSYIGSNFRHRLME